MLSPWHGIPRRWQRMTWPCMPCDWFHQSMVFRVKVRWHAPCAGRLHDGLRSAALHDGSSRWWALNYYCQILSVGVEGKAVNRSLDQFRVPSHYLLSNPWCPAVVRNETSNDVAGRFMEQKSPINGSEALFLFVPQISIYVFIYI